MSGAAHPPDDPTDRFPIAPSPRALGPLVVGLVGGIASGKSMVAAAFAARGLEHVDADAIAREVTAEPEVLDAIRERFGAGAIAADGTLDRPALARTVFDDPNARADLEALTHPRIRERIETRLAAARAAGHPVLLDVPLLIEGGLIERCQQVVFVDTPDARRAEFAAARGWEPAELARREAAQVPLAVKRARSTATIQNRGSRDALQPQVDRLLARWAAAEGSAEH